MGRQQDHCAHAEGMHAMEEEEQNPAHALRRDAVLTLDENHKLAKAKGLQLAIEHNQETYPELTKGGLTAHNSSKELLHVRCASVPNKRLDVKGRDRSNDCKLSYKFVRQMDGKELSNKWKLTQLDGKHTCVDMTDRKRSVNYEVMEAFGIPALNDFKPVKVVGKHVGQVNALMNTANQQGVANHAPTVTHHLVKRRVAEANSSSRPDHIMGYLYLVALLGMCSEAG